MESEISLLCLQQPTTDTEHVTEAYTAHSSHSIYLRSILIIILYLHLGLPSGHVPSGVPNNILYAFLSFLTQATCPTHLILLDFITTVTSWEQHKWWSYSLHNFLHPHSTSNFLHSCSPWHTVNTPSQSSLNVRPSFTSKWRTTPKMTDFYIFPFSMATRETFPWGKVTRTWSPIYCQGEQWVELTFNFPICLHGSHTKCTFPSTITTFRW